MMTVAALAESMLSSELPFVPPHSAPRVANTMLRTACCVLRAARGLYG